MRKSLVGTKIGSYDVLEELGRGGMGIVYKAHQASLGRYVALKILPYGLESDPDYLQRFRREALAAAQLNHPNIVTIYDISNDGHTHYIAMEFVQGRELAALIKSQGRMGTRDALTVARQVAGALGAAHAVHIIHRDIKPSNIMIDSTGRAKVMDFGIAKVQTANTQLTRGGLILGTPEYMSPEQVQGHEIDCRADVYALGVVIYHMLAGQVPYTATTPLAVMRKIVEDPIPSINEFKPKLPESVSDLLEKALAKDPKDRFESGAEMEDAIARILYSGELDGEETTFSSPRIQGPPPTTPVRPMTAGGSAPRVTAPSQLPDITFSPPRRTGSRVAIGAASIAGVALIGVAAFIAMKKRPEPPPEPPKPVAAATATPEPAATAVAVPAQPTPQATPELSLPKLRWKEAPDDGAEVKTAQVALSWEIANDALVKGFLVGLNDPSPKLIMTELSKTFDLETEGEQVVTVIPLNENNVKGEEIQRKFIYRRPQPPTLKGKLRAESLAVGEAGKLSLTAADPRKEEVKLEARVDGGAWAAIAEIEKSMGTQPPGKHIVEARATNASGVASDIWSATFEVKKPAMAEPAAATAMPIPTAKPGEPAPKGDATAPAGKIVSSAGGTFTKIAEAIAKSPAGSKLTLGPGTYAESLVIDKKLEIVGGGGRETIIIEPPSGPCLVVKGGEATLRGLTLRATKGKGEFTLAEGKGAPSPSEGSFKGEFAGAILASGGKLVAEDCVLQTGLFPALKVERGADPVLRKCAIKGKGRSAAAEFGEGSKGRLEECDLSGAFLWGVDVRSGAAPTLVRCRIHAFELDGIYFGEGAGGTVEDCDIFDNESHGVTLDKGSNPAIRGSRIVKNGMEGITAPGESGATIEGTDLTRNGGLGAFNLSITAKKSVKLSNNQDE